MASCLFADSFLDVFSAFVSTLRDMGRWSPWGWSPVRDTVFMGVQEGNVVVCSDRRGGVQEGKALAADPSVSGSPSEQARRCNPLQRKGDRTLAKCTQH